MGGIFNPPGVPSSRQVIAGTNMAGGGSLIGNVTLNGLSTEEIQDLVAAMMVAGTNMTITYNDGAGTLTYDASGGSSGAEVIESHTFNGATNSYTFNSIPNTYSKLELEIIGRTTAASQFEQVNIAFNSVVANYSQQIMFCSVASVSGAEILNGSSFQLGGISGTLSISDNIGFIRATFPLYAAGLAKQIDWTTKQSNSTVLDRSHIISGVGTNPDTDPISSLIVSVAAGNFTNGSIARLLGIA